MVRMAQNSAHDDHRDRQLQSGTGVKIITTPAIRTSGPGAGPEDERALQRRAGSQVALHQPRKVWL